jgi:hypothetical protein
MEVPVRLGQHAFSRLRAGIYFDLAEFGVRGSVLLEPKIGGSRAVTVAANL